MKTWLKILEQGREGIIHKEPWFVDGTTASTSKSHEIPKISATQTLLKLTWISWYQNN